MSSLTSPLVENGECSSSDKIDMEIAVESIQNNYPKLATTKHIVLLGLLIFGFAFSYNVAFSIGVTKYFASWGLSVTWGNNAALLGFAAQAFTNLFVGFQSDRFVSKYGRRKPFIAVGNLLQQVGVFLLCLPPVHGGIAVAGWYSLFFIIFNIGNSMCHGPFDAMMIESTRDDDDYRIFTTIVFPICLLTGGVSGTLVTIISPVVAAFISLTVNIISTLLLIYRVETAVIRVTEKNPDLIPSVRIAARTHEFKSIFLYKVLINSAITIFLACYAYYLLIGFDIEDIKKYVQLLIIIAYAAGGVGISIVMACNWLLRFVDKVQLLQALLLMGAVFTFVSLFVILPSSSSLTGYVVICILVAMVGFPGRLIETLILRDLVVYDTFTTGLHRENMFLTAINLPTNILSTLIGAAPGVFIALTGYTEHNDDVDDDQIDQLYGWTSSTLWMLRVLGSIVCPILALAAFAVMRNYALRDKIVAKMNDAIKSKEEKEKEFASLDQDRSDTGITTGNVLPDEQKQHIMHLSLEEIGVLTNDRISISLDNLKSYSLLNFALAVGCTVLILTILCIDITAGEAHFTTLFITLLLLCLFFSMYEYFRVLAMTDIASRYTREQFLMFANECYVEYSHYHESLKQLMKRHGIHFTDAMSMSTSASVSLFSPIIEESAKPDRLSGHKRLYFCAACIVGLSVAIGCVILV